MEDKETLRKRVQAYQTFQHTSDSNAIKMGINRVNIDVVN
jgi:hypothetical protein